MKLIRKSTLFISFVALIMGLSSCGPSNNIEDYDCPCWSDNKKVKKETINAEKGRS